MKVTWFDLVTPVTFGTPKRPPGTWWQFTLVTLGVLSLPLVLLFLAIGRFRELDGAAAWISPLLGAGAAAVLFCWVLVAMVGHERSIREGSGGPHTVSRGVGLVAGFVGATVGTLLPPAVAGPSFAAVAGGIAPIAMIWVLRVPAVIGQMRLPG